MRRLSAVALIALLAVGAVPARGTSLGRIEGVVVHGDTGDPQRGVDVTLKIARVGEPDVESRVATTGRDGAYSFDDLETGDGITYVVDAHYQGGTFPGSPITIPDDTDEPPVFETRIRVWDTTRDPDAILIRRNSIVLVPDEGHVGVLESVTIANTSAHAYIGRRGNTTLGFALPPGAADGGVQVVESTLDVPELVPTDFGFALTVAIPPGETRIAYSYRIGGIVGTYDVARRALYPVSEVTVLAADPLTVESPRLTAGDDVELGGRTYATWSSDTVVDAGAPIPLTAVAQAGMSPVVVPAVAAVVIVVLGTASFAVARRGARRPAPARRKDEPPVRARLVEEIATLDLAFSSGDLAREEWEERRAAIKARLEREPSSS